MNDEPREKLRAALAEHGTAVLEDPARSLALVRELGVEHRREVFALATAYQARVPHDLLASPRAVPLPAVLDQQTRRLCAETALAEDAARWAVEAWAAALNLSPAPTPAGTAALPALPPEPVPTPAPEPPSIFGQEPGLLPSPAEAPLTTDPTQSPSDAGQSKIQNPKSRVPNPQSAIRNPQSAIGSIAPEELERRLREAHLQLRRGNSPAAEKLCRLVLSHSPDDPTALEMLGDLHAERGDLDEALAAYRRAAGGEAPSPTLEEKIGRVVVLKEEAERAEIVERLGLEVVKSPANLKRRKQMILLIGSLLIFALALAAMWFSLNEMNVGSGRTTIRRPR